ncbi:universal stress protein [Xylanimonas protaetiae]|uniref:Universal stress protein n=1 Tax=Xylanimonas protaetiae TaxID=2509457 RepID=A0A4P6F2B1_9MICO|nr:universal stress protein [Xylanimonas protaetiae]QAY69295.1 universal stress protein [Xylanimonas protaetiae]
MRGIVVGINETDEAREALDWALAEATSRGTTLTAVSAGGDDPSQGRTVWAEQLVGEAKRRVGAACPTSVVAVAGSAREALLEAAEGSEQLVLGRRRLSKLGRLVLGSVSAEVVERASVPVTVVRHAGDAAVPAVTAAATSDGTALLPRDVVASGPRVVVGVDSSLASVLAVRHAAEVARRTGSTLQVVYAWQTSGLAPLPGTWAGIPSGEDYERHARELLDRAVEAAGIDLPAGRLERTVVNAAPAAALVDASATAGRVVVGSRGLGGFGRLLLGSVSRQVLDYAACPVTVVR